VQPRLLDDPGDGGTIPGTQVALIGLTSGASGETRVLAAPTHIGMELDLFMVTDGGGDIAVTASPAVNQAGNNTLTFAEAGDHIRFVGVGGVAGMSGIVGFAVAGVPAWRVVSNNGVALSTV
jgi:hypothetical protein